MARLLGVLGGMGPLATADFFKKLIEETPAQYDEEHVPVVIYSVPQMPDRVKAITHGAESPLPHMLAGMRALQRLEVGCVAIPCNTAHHWFEELQRASGLPILHIADAACDELHKRGSVEEGGEAVERAAMLLFDRGVENVILGCTELPVALDAIRSRACGRCVDATRALARECVAWSLAAS